MKYLFVKKIKLALILTEHTARVSGLFPRSWCFISELWRHNVVFKVNFVYLILKPWFTYFCLYFVYVKFLNIIKKNQIAHSPYHSYNSSPFLFGWLLYIFPMQWSNRYLYFWSSTAKDKKRLHMKRLIRPELPPARVDIRWLH